MTFMKVKSGNDLTAPQPKSTVLLVDQIIYYIRINAL